MKSDLLTVDEVAKRLRVSRMTVYRAVNEGRLTSLRVGKMFRIRPEDVQKWLVNEAVRREEEKHG